VKLPSSSTYDKKTKMAALSTETAAKILGVSLDYSLEDLREAYRKTLQEVCFIVVKP